MGIAVTMDAPVETLAIDRFWQSADGLRLHLRDYPADDPGAAARPALLCLPGLTRNARDFAELATHFAGAWRVLCPEMRGRGKSAWAADSATYNAAQYVADVLAMLDALEVDRFVAIGTSLGGLMTMALARIVPQRLAGAVINDVGPVLEPAGLAAISAYVGRDGTFADWPAAAAHLQARSGAVFPDVDEGGWLAAAQRRMTRDAGGALCFAYDPRIADAFRGNPAPLPDMWPALEALAGRPLLLLRGALSDLLSGETFAEMRRRLPDAAALTLPRVGHAPELDEPAALAAIGALLDRVR